MVPKENILFKVLYFSYLVFFSLFEVVEKCNTLLPLATLFRINLFSLILFRLICTCKIL